MSDPANVDPPSIECFKVTKRFGPFVALDEVSMKLAPCSFHALLGENGAGKSTLVKCIMGYYKADEGGIMVDEHEVEMSNPRDAQALGIGMVYQHFTLVPNMTVAENFVMARTKLPMILDWKKEMRDLDEFMSRMPFRIDPKAPVRTLAAGQKQKVEILKQLYLKSKVLILDEPTSVLTPAEADEILGLLHRMVQNRKLSILMITHKFKQVMEFADEVTVLRRGKLTGRGYVKDLTPAAMAEMMIGKQFSKEMAARVTQERGAEKIKIQKLSAIDETGKKTLKDVNLTVHAGEVVGIAGVSGNGQRELVEVLAGQRARTAGTIEVKGEPYFATREEMFRHRVFCLPEEPLKNACVPDMSVSDNLALRNFDQSPQSFWRWMLNGRAIKRNAVDLIDRYKVKTPSPSAPIGKLSGGNVQRAVLAREISGKVDVLIVANPVFGLDFAAVADIHAQIMDARNRGVAVLLVSEDLDELFELSDRILVMFCGELAYETKIENADLATIGAHMAGMNTSAPASASIANKLSSEPVTAHA